MRLLRPEMNRARETARCGVVGEETNKRAGSRRLDTPLAAIVLPSPTAGKSSLMEAILAFVLEEQRSSMPKPGPTARRFSR